MKLKNKTVVIIGASSGIGKELALQYLERGYELGILARRENLLQEIKKQSPSNVSCKVLDVADFNTQDFLKFLKEFKAVDLIINAAGIGFLNPDLEFKKENATNKVNVDGFTQVTVASIKFFEEQGHGHYVNISSMAALIGRAICPAYNASKAYQSNYLEAMRQRLYSKNHEIYITDIKPGFVDTGMAKVSEGEKPFWIQSTEKAAGQIIRAIDKKKYTAYITRRWGIVAWLVKMSPLWLRKRL